MGTLDEPGQTPPAPDGPGAATDACPDAPLARARREAEEARAQGDALLRMVAHDLRGPLGTLLIQAQLLRRRLDRDGEVPPDRLAASLDRIERQGLQMRALLARVSDLAALTAGRPLALELRPVDLVALVQGVVEGVVAGEHGGGRHEIAVIAPGPVEVQADPARIEQVVEALLDNAIRYSPAGGQVRLRVEARGGQAVLEVADEGIGVPEADQARIFEWFTRGGNVPEGVGGRGLGLAAGRAIAAQHGGALAVHSRPGAGATFTLQLPRAPEGPGDG